MACKILTRTKIVLLFAKSEQNKVAKYLFDSDGVYLYHITFPPSSNPCVHIDSKLRAKHADVFRKNSQDQLNKSLIIEHEGTSYVIVFLTSRQISSFKKAGYKFSRHVQIANDIDFMPDILDRLKAVIVPFKEKSSVSAIAKRAYYRYKGAAKIPTLDYEVFYDPKSSELQFDPMHTTIDYFITKKNRRPVDIALSKHAAAATAVLKKFPLYLAAYKQFYIRRKVLFQIDELEDILNSEYSDNFIDVMVKITIELLYVEHHLRKNGFFNMQGKIKQRTQVFKTALKFWSYLKYLFPMLARPDLVAHLKYVMLL